MENLCKVVVIVSSLYHEQQISKIVNYVEKLTKQQYLACEIENYFTKDWLKLKQIHARNFNKMNICKLIWQVLAHFHIQNDFV